MRGAWCDWYKNSINYGQAVGFVWYFIIPYHSCTRLDNAVFLLKQDRYDSVTNWTFYKMNKISVLCLISNCLSVPDFVVELKLLEICLFGAQ